MRNAVLALLSFYQRYISPALHMILGTKHACRYSPTCSEFATIHIQKEGVIKGGLKSLLRVLYCQPFVDELPPALKK
ncbi:MAG TPA: membrane protein insertion efficiency factor YidD [Candidatus Saccharimonadales bacterium]|nr:membrane protein insertion efficiency factor YidD [Candidatus Saccharimonadales bacterium]